VWQLPLSQTCTSTADVQGNFGGYFQSGSYQFTETVSGKTFGPYEFSVSLNTGGGTVLNPQKLGTYYYADGFPNTCTVGGTNYTTQLDCAWYTALATTITVTANPTVIVGSNNYTTCAGLPMILPGATGPTSVNLVSLGLSANLNPGNLNPTPATITQTCAISTGTVSLPVVAGASAKQVTLEGVSIDAAHLAPYAVQMLGYNENSVFRQGQAMNGTTGDMLFGVFASFPDGQSVGDELEDWLVVDNCSVTNGCGGGGAVTVSLSGGVPSFTVTAPGSNYDANTIATLVGYQNGTRNNPCSSMGTTTASTSGGALTGITSSATGCVGTVYVQLTDERKPNYGVDLENFTDSNKVSGLDIRTGATAGLRCAGCGSDVFVGIHAWGQGLFGIQSGSYSTFVGTNCGEVSLACFDNFSSFAKTTVLGTMYNSGTQYQGYSVFRNETDTSIFKILGLQCQSTQTAEFHTLANEFGPIDTNANANATKILGNSLKDVEYCGSGTGETVNAIPGGTSIVGSILAPSTNTITAGLIFSLNSTPFVDCTATGFTTAPTISGSVITFLSNGTDNAGSVTCTDFAGRITIQSVPNSGTPTLSQTFDLTSQFAASGATWVKLDPAFASGTVFVNAPNGLVVQNGGGVTVGTTTLIKSSVTLTNGAASGAGTITNAPTAGNPTKWIPINDNGTTRYIPAW
jgi:hypothetical protein